MPIRGSLTPWQTYREMECSVIYNDINDINNYEAVTTYDEYDKRSSAVRLCPGEE